MKKKKNLLVTALLLLGCLVYGQEENKNDKILNAVSDYFYLERENIHAHFDKTTFTPDESIWFKGYVFHRKANTPFFSTVNIYGSIIGPDGNIIATKLFYGNSGSFSGNFSLDENFTAGRYYIRFYTNWMNNFIEDESSVYEIDIVNPGTDSTPSYNKNLSTINIEVNPEGGTLLKGLDNTVGIYITDCEKKPLPLNSVDIVDATGKTIMKTIINPQGYGKFVLPANQSGCKAVVAFNGKTYEKNLPPAVLTGYSIEANSYTLKDKVILKIRTNKTTYDAANTAPVYLLIHQDDKGTVAKLQLDDTTFEQTLTVPAQHLRNGINTVRILDSNLTQLAERMFFNNTGEPLQLDIKPGEKDAGTKNYVANISQPSMNLSLSVLPDTSNNFDHTTDIYGALLIQPYVENLKTICGRYYLSPGSKSKLYELDLLLLNKKSKHKWINILHYPPKASHTFDIGLTLRGRIPKNIDAKSLNIRMYSLFGGIDATTTVNAQNEFYFENLVITDSTHVNFTLIKPGEEPKELNINPEITNLARPYNKPFQTGMTNECIGFTANTSAERIIKKKNTTLLDEVKIEGVALKHRNKPGNKNLSVYKMSVFKPTLRQMLPSFINTYGGFCAGDNGYAQLVIVTKNGNPLGIPNEGALVYLNDERLSNFDVLRTMNMGMIDEIYFSDTYRFDRHIGLIKIYLKKGVNPYTKNQTLSIIIPKGFEKVVDYKNVVAYNDTDNTGIINWKSSVSTNANGEFRFDLPQNYTKNVKVLIEGFSADGKLISDLKTITNE